jgi:hypothetical protein
MAEPLNLNLVISQTDFVSSTRYLTALAFQNINTVISPGYLLRWETPSINTTGYTLSVAYMSGSGGTFVASVCSIFVAYNTTNLFSSTPTEYFLINTLNPLTTNITSNINGNSIKNQNTFSETATSVQVEFFPNFDTTNNYAPTNFEISAIAFDNKPYVRSLTATIIQDTGGSAGKVIAQGQTPFKWMFPTSNVWAYKTDGTPYISNTVEPISSINTLIFNLTADTYDFRTTNYTLCTTDIVATNNVLFNTDTYQVVYDTFPDIDLNVFINYENTKFSTYFYRLTSTLPLTASPDLFPNFIRLSSTDIDLITSLTGSSYSAWYTANNTQTKIQLLSTITQFNRSVPGVSSVQGYLSAYNLNNSFSDWYSPHILQYSLSCIFVPYFLEGDFIGAPKAYFKLPILSPVKYELLTDLSDTPGLRFYGEGHTETIFLSTQNIHSLATGTIWSVDNKIQNPQLSLLTSISVSITSQSNLDVRLPISLQITNNLFLSTGPTYYFDDTTGIKTTYPFYITTVDIFGNELPTNTKFKESIHILPYPPLNLEFIPGIESTVFLPANGSIVSYQASLRTSIDSNALLKCYGKYGLLWDWQSYTGCSTNPQSFTNKPSSWETTSCSGSFPKQWTLTDKLSTDLFNTNPVKCSTSNITWTISSTPSLEVESFFNQFTGPALDNENFCYDLSLRNMGGDILPGINNCNGLHYTTSTAENTNITLNVKQPVTCLISAEQLPPEYINDWLPREIIIDQTKSILSITSPVIKIYTPNRYVLTGTNVFFENLITNINAVASIFINFDNNKTLFLTGSDVKNSFNISYENVGSKTLLITVNTNYTDVPITTTFTDIVKVVAEYDDVSPTEYRSTNTPIELPWPNKPVFGSNDWVVEDNINNWFIKFQDNLNYLESRARIYPGTFTEYFGYFGVQPAPGPVSACTPWTWEDLDCFNTSLPYEVTWRDVLSAEDPFDQDGIFVQQECGTWQTSECSFSAINPTCYGLHDVNWSWRQRKKRSSLKPIKWKETKLNNVYQKRWYFEITDSQFLTVCNRSVWNVNIPGLNTYYDPIAYSFVQPRCIYYGIASQNNKLYIAQKNTIKLFDLNQTANFIDYEDTTDGVVRFSNIKNICLDSAGKIYILDNILSKVSVYTYKRETPGDDFKPFVEWGGFGTAASQYKFSFPNDIHIDQLDNVWVTDTGNNCVKHYSNTGTWLKTIVDDNLKQNTPLSTAVDSLNNVHILTKTDIRVYNYNGEYLFNYSYKEQSSAEPRRINTSYNREVIYLALDTQVLKYFRNGVFFGYIIEEKENVFNITSVYQDEFRNLLITTNDKILKYPDLMSIKRLKGILPTAYWSIEDILIHKEEYVQSWVYTKAFQRMWDNIEIFRNTLLFENTSVCKSYKPPLHGKDKMIIGQNEIVTSTVVNRVLSYLWDNLTSLLDYFDPNCKEPL